MRWRPRLVLRFDRRGVASPTSTVGHLLAVVVNAVIAAGATAALLVTPERERWTALVVAAWAVLLGRALVDAWAWLAATRAERAAFRAAVESFRAWSSGGGYAPVFDADRWGRAAWALAFAALAAPVAIARWHAEVVVPAMFAAAFLAAGGLDLARRGRRVDLRGARAAS